VFDLVYLPLKQKKIVSHTLTITVLPIQIFNSPIHWRLSQFYTSRDDFVHIPARSIVCQDKLTKMRVVFPLPQYQPELLNKI